ncbi:hypothetical protein Ddc_00335 [Ditylenchus destructor]|nr:hypothetical protein Ddc_00335 [Ditylenchus destructor]
MNMEWEGSSLPPPPPYSPPNVYNQQSGGFSNIMAGNNTNSRNAPNGSATMSSTEPQVAITIPVERQTVIESHSPSEIDCDNCHKRIVTKTELLITKENEWEGNFWPGILFVLGVTFFLSSCRASTRNPKLALAGFVLAILPCIGGCCMLTMFPYRKEYKINHTCPYCNFTLAQVSISEVEAKTSNVQSIIV